MALRRAAPDPVAITVPDAPEPGDAISVDVDARDAVVRAGADATVDATLTAARRRHAADQAAPRRSRERPLSRRRSRPEQPGLYRIHAEARRGDDVARRRRSLDVCRRRGSRVRRSAAERRVPAPRGAQLGRPLRPRRRGARRCRRGSQADRAAERAPERRDLWHEPWAFALVIVLLCRRSGSCGGAGGCDEFRFESRASRSSRWRLRPWRVRVARRAGLRSRAARRRALRADRHRRVRRRRLRAEIRRSGAPRSSTTLRDEFQLRAASGSSCWRETESEGVQKATRENVQRVARRSAQAHDQGRSAARAASSATARRSTATKPSSTWSARI